MVNKCGQILCRVSRLAQGSWSTSPLISIMLPHALPVLFTAFKKRSRMHSGTTGSARLPRKWTMQLAKTCMSYSINYNNHNLINHSARSIIPSLTTHQRRIRSQLHEVPDNVYNRVLTGRFTVNPTLDERARLNLGDTVTDQGRDAVPG